jgi:hypothetical protein
MKNSISTSAKIELIKNQIEIKEFKYKTAISRNKNYVILKRLRDKIRDLKSSLQLLTEEQ